MSYRSLNRAYVYIMSNYERTCLYVGVTNNIERRVNEHRNGLGDFTSRYRLNYLIYYEVVSNFGLAIKREKRIKRWRREWKFELIRSENPRMEDIAKDWEWFEVSYGKDPGSAGEHIVKPPGVTGRPGCPS
jgi:putative endonuclease